MSGRTSAGAGRVPVIVAVSPHLDDAAFSAGGFLAGAAARGALVRVVTLFTATVPNPRGFALACQTDKGFSPEVDYMALRRAEDRLAMATLGVEYVHLDLAEAPHRGYHSAAALFGPVLAHDADTPRVVARALEQEFEGGAAPDLVLGPRALGHHVDHRHVRHALDVLAGRHRVPVVLWDDIPYALRLRSDADDVAGQHERMPSAGEMSAKVLACAAYPSQLGFQFGNVQAMESELRGAPERFDSDPRTHLNCA